MFIGLLVWNTFLYPPAVRGRHWSYPRPRCKPVLAPTADVGRARRGKQAPRTPPLRTRSDGLRGKRGARGLNLHVVFGVFAFRDFSAKCAVRCLKKIREKYALLFLREELLGLFG